jgi:hypothetical protein
MIFLASKYVRYFLIFIIILPVFGTQTCRTGVQLFLDIDRLDIENFITARKKSSKPIIVDIGGEGINRDAININPEQYTSSSDNTLPIPLWVKGRGESIPVKDGEVDHLILENTPLNNNIIIEIIRVIKKDGTIKLVHPIEYAQKTHAELSLHFPAARVSQKRLRHGLLQTIIELNVNN